MTAWRRRYRSDDVVLEFPAPVSRLFRDAYM